MNRFLIIGIIILVLAAAGAYFIFFSDKLPSGSPILAPIERIRSTGLGSQLYDQLGSSINKVPESNPFQKTETNPLEAVKTNPFEGGYSNPFEE